MPRVAELSVDINAKDDATATILALDALIKGLDKSDVDIDINADTGDAESDISRLIAEINSIDDEKIEIAVDTDGAMGEIAKLEAELAGIGDEKVTIETDIDTDGIRKGRIDMDRLTESALSASRQISILAAGVLGLGAALVPIGAVAVGGIAALSGALITAGIGVGLFGAVAVTNFRNVGDALSKLDTLQKAFNQAVTDTQRDAALEKMKALMESLTPAEQAMVKEVQNFQKVWRDFSAEFQPQIFQIATEGLRGMSALLPSLAPIVSGAANAFLFLERMGVRALQGPFWQSFIGMIGTNINPLLRDFGRSIGNLVTGFAGMIMAFMPLSRDFSGGLVEMTGAFADWAKGLGDNKGFQDFVAYIRENTPAVLDMIGAFVDGFIGLVKAAAPVGAVLVTMATNLFNAVAAFEDAHPAIFSAVIAIVAFSAVALNLLGPIIVIGRLILLLVSGFLSLGGMISAVAGFLGIGVGAFLGIIAVIALVIGAIVYAYTHFEGFRDLVSTVASAIVTFGQKVYAGIVTGLQTAAAWLSATFGPAVAAVVDFVVDEFNKMVAWVNENQATFAAAWETIKTIVSGVWTAIVTVIRVGLAVISAAWSAVWPTLSAILLGVWTAIKGIISGALEVIRGIILVFAGFLAGDWSAIWAGVVSILRGVWTVIWGIVRGAVQVLQAIIRAGISVITTIFMAGWRLMISGLSAAWATIRSIVSAGWNAIRSASSTAMNAIQNAINAGWRAIGAVVMGAIRLMVSGLQSAWSTIVSLVTGAMSRLTGAIRSGFSNALGAVRSFGSSAIGLVRGLGGQFFSAGVSIMRSLGSGIASAVGSAVSAVSGAIGRITSMLPGSPAKMGPLSGQGYALIRGQHLSEDLAAGIASRKGLVGSAAADIADLMALQFDSGGAFDAITRGATARSGAGGGNTITVAPGAITLTIGGGASASEAREAFNGAGDELADKLLMALRRQ